MSSPPLSERSSSTSPIGRTLRSINATVPVHPLLRTSGTDTNSCEWTTSRSTFQSKGPTSQRRPNNDEGGVAVFAVITTVSVEEGSIPGLSALFDQTNGALVAQHDDWLGAWFTTNHDRSEVTVIARWADPKSYERLPASDEFPGDQEPVRSEVRRAAFGLDQRDPGGDVVPASTPVHAR